MDGKARRKRARADTHGLKDLRRGLFSAFTVGAVSVLGLWRFGSENAVKDEAILLVCLVVASVFVRPALELAWNYFWTPWRVLNERVDTLASAPAPAAIAPAPAGGGPMLPQTKSAGVAAQAKFVQAQLMLLRKFQNELRGMIKGGRRALDEDAAQRLKVETLTWEYNSATVSGQNNWQNLYEKLRDAYEAINDLGYWPRMGLLSDEQKEKLTALLPVLEEGLEAVDHELKKVTG